MNLKVLEIEHKKDNDSPLPLYKRRIGPGEKGGEQQDSSCPTHVYIPLTLTKTVQSELISDFSSIHRIWQVLLVGEHQQESITKLIFVQHTLEFFAGLRNTFAVIRVDNEDDALCVLEVCI